MGPKLIHEMYKEFLSIVAIALTFIAFYPYIRSIRLGKTKPHLFSWVIWGSTTFIVFMAQLSDNAGAGAWPIGLSGIITIYVAWLAYKIRADCTITRSDWLFFITAMSSLPLWFYTADPLWAVVILTTVDIIGFGPTFRKAYHQPYDEQRTFFAIFTVRNIVAIMALEHYSMTTVLFPAAIAVATVLLITLITYRRQRVISQ